MSKKEIYQRFKRNAAMILGSHLVFGILNVITSMLMVRLFGLTELGIVILLQSYTRLFNMFLKFNSWQAVVTYGAQLQEKNDHQGLKRLLSLLLTIDFSSLFIGVLCAMIFVPYAADIFDWSGQVAEFAPIYVISIFFVANAAPAGVLRLFDRVDALAIKYALRSAIRFVGVLLAAYLGGNVFHLVLVWFTASVISGLWPLLVCFSELRKHNLFPHLNLHWFKAGKEFKGIWRFLVFSNASTAVGFAYRTGTTLFLGITLGAAPAAIFEIAFQFGSALSQPMKTLSPIISPEFAKLVAKGDWVTFRKIITHQLKITGIFLIVAGVVLFSTLSLILEIVYGKEVLTDIWLFRLLLVYSLLKILTFTFSPALLSANKPGTLLLIRSAAVLFYCLLAVSLIGQFGLTAIGFSAVLSHLLFMAIITFTGKRLLKKRIRKNRIR